MRGNEMHIISKLVVQKVLSHFSRSLWSLQESVRSE